MVLNYIWIGFFVVAFIIALIKVIFLGDTEIFTAIMNSTFDSSKTAFEISLGLTGVLALWLGIMKVGENSGLINALARFLSPVLCRLFPDIPKGHPVLGSIFMNMSANMLGLDNAATPLGLKAMKELQELNPKKDTASNPMIMFLVINTSGLIIIPISIMVYRAQMGAAQPTDVFIPILLSTFISTLVGVIAVSIAQKINLINKPILILMGIICLFFSGLIYLFLSVSREDMGTYSTLIANILLFSVIILFILTGVRKKINVYDSFVEGAKEGFTTAVRIIPYLVAFLVGIAVFRTSGAMDFLVGGIGYVVGLCGVDTSFVGALPTALMKSLSGSGANGLMIDTMKELGPDSPRFHYEIGTYIAENPVDKLAVLGELAREIARGVREQAPEIRVYEFMDRESLIGWLKTELREGDTVLFKGSNSMELGKVAAVFLEKQTTENGV